MRMRLLPVLILVALVTLGVRVGDLWQGLALAAQSDQQAQKEPPAASPVAAPQAAEGEAAAAAAEGAAAAPQTAALPVDPFSLTDSEIELLQKLAVRREELERRSVEIEQREALLSAAESRIEDRIGELKALQEKIGTLLVKRDELQEAQYRSLVKIYESMKPKEAARIFEELDMTVLLEVVDRMKERKSAPILAKMNPDRAKEITIELAARHKLPVPDK